MEKLKNNLSLILGAIVILLIIALNFKQCSSERDNKAAIEQYERNITALNDSIVKTVNKKGDTVYIEKAVEADLDQILGSSAFKNLSKEKQQFWLELKEQKGIIAAQQATITSQQRLISDLAYGNDVNQTDSSVTFKKGSSLEFKDKKGNFSYFAKITFLDKAHIQIEPKYDLQINSSFKRQKDKSIIVEYQLDDPNATVKNGQSFIIPQEDKTKWQKILEKGIKVGRVAIPVACFAGGVYVGAVLVK